MSRRKPRHSFGRELQNSLPTHLKAAVPADAGRALDYALDSAFRRAGRSPMSKRPFSGLGPFSDLVDALETISGGRWFRERWRPTHIRERHSRDYSEDDDSNHHTPTWIADFCADCRAEYLGGNVQRPLTVESIEEYTRKVNHNIDDALDNLNHWTTASVALRCFRGSEAESAWKLLEAIAADAQEREAEFTCQNRSS